MALIVKKRFNLILLFVLLFILLADLSSAANSSDSLNLMINVTETGKIIKYYDQYYITRVTGNINMTNPSQVSDLFRISIPFVLPPGMTLVDTGTNRVVGNEIQIDTIRYSSYINTSYKIVGITTANPMRNNNSVLLSALTHRGEIRGYSDLKWKITKSAKHDTGNTPGEGSARLVVAEVYNPTEFEFQLEFLKIIKSTDMDPNNVIRIWNKVYPENETVIMPTTIFRADLVDENLTEQDIYWLNLNLYLKGVTVNGTHNIAQLTEQNLSVLGEPTEVVDGEILNASLMEENLFLRKFVTASVVNPGDLVNVTIIINNLDPHNRNLQILDIYPVGFQIVDKGDAKELDNRTLFWNISLNPDSVISLNYQIKFVDENSVGVDYFEATKMIFENKTFYSRTIPYIRRYVPESKAYIQKKLRTLSSGEIEVTIDIKNIGEDNIRNVILKEYLDKADMFREITKLPEGKGVWSISNIKPGETWTVTYITDENERNLVLPIIFGISQGNVLQTLMLDAVVKYNFFFSSINYIEYIGIAALVTIPLALMILRRRKKIDYVIQLNRLDKQIDTLIKSTHIDFAMDLPEIEKTKIDKLQKDLEELKEVKPDKLSDEQKDKIANWIKNNQKYIDGLMKDTKK